MSGRIVTGLVAVAESKGVVPEEQVPSVPAGQDRQPCSKCGFPGQSRRPDGRFVCGACEWYVPGPGEVRPALERAREMVRGDGVPDGVAALEREMASLRAENARLRSALQEPMRSGECICVRCSLRQGRIGGVQGNF